MDLFLSMEKVMLDGLFMFRESKKNIKKTSGGILVWVDNLAQQRFNSKLNIVSFS